MPQVTSHVEEKTAVVLGVGSVPLNNTLIDSGATCNTGKDYMKLDEGRTDVA